MLTNWVMLRKDAWLDIARILLQMEARLKAHIRVGIPFNVRSQVELRCMQHLLMTLFCTKTSESFCCTKKTRKQPSTTDLLVSFSSGSHHISLLGHLAISFNSLLDKEPQNVRATLSPLPVFQDVNTDKVFGLVQSEQTESFGGLLIIKEEVKETEDQVLQELSWCILEDSDAGGDSDLSARLGIDPTLLSIANQPSGIQCVIEKSLNPIPGLSSK